jgi:hypothetical protein
MRTLLNVDADIVHVDGWDTEKVILVVCINTTRCNTLFFEL